MFCCTTRHRVEKHLRRDAGSEDRRPLAAAWLSAASGTRCSRSRVTVSAVKTWLFEIDLRVMLDVNRKERIGMNWPLSSKSRDADPYPLTRSTRPRSTRARHDGQRPRWRRRQATERRQIHQVRTARRPASSASPDAGGVRLDDYAAPLARFLLHPVVRKPRHAVESNLVEPRDVSRQLNPGRRCPAPSPSCGRSSSRTSAG